MNISLNRDLLIIMAVIHYFSLKNACCTLGEETHLNGIKTSIKLTQIAQIQQNPSLTYLRHRICVSLTRGSSHVHSYHNNNNERGACHSFWNCATPVNILMKHDWIYLGDRENIWTNFFCSCVRNYKFGVGD